MTIALVVAIGAAGGVLAGLFGVGGGIIFVPTLALVLGLTQLHAEASSLLAISRRRSWERGGSEATATSTSAPRR